MDVAFDASRGSAKRAHAEAAGSLPWHHRDPFDRLLVAQATAENAVLVSGDERLRAYGVRVEW